MYRPPGLTKAQLAEVYKALRLSHTYVVTPTMHDLNDKPFRKLPGISDGQVNGTGLGRSISCTFADPDRRLHPVEGINCGKYIFHPTYDVTVDALDKVEQIPLGSFVLDSCVRNDNMVTITGRGKGALHMRDVGEPFTIPKGVKKTEAIMRIAEAAGELRSHMDIPDKAALLTADLVVGSLSSFWAHEQELATSLNLLLYYDALGRLKARPQPTASAFTFRMYDADKQNGFMTVMPNVAANMPSFHNEVWFYYGAKGDQVVKVAAPDDHPLSAKSQAWHGKPARHILKVVRKTVHLASTATVQANAILGRELLHTVKVQGECFPFPFMESGDLYRISSRDYVGLTTLDWTLPLLPGATQTLGWTDVRSRGVSL